MVHAEKGVHVMKVLQTIFQEEDLAALFAGLLIGQFLQASILTARVSIMWQRIRFSVRVV